MTVTQNIPIAEIDIARRAFVIMEVTPPNSFDDDTAIALEAQEQYPRAWRMALEGYDWSFARRVAVLPPATLPDLEAADPDLPYQFILPGDFLAMRHVHEGTMFRWRVDAASLLRTDREGPITIRYTVDRVDGTRVAETFKELVAHNLAVLLMPRHVGTRSKRDQIRADLQETAFVARSNDAHTASIAPFRAGAQDDWAGGATL